MNTALNQALRVQEQTAQVYKYGTVPNIISYPYFQSSYRVKWRQPYGSSISGVLTDFEYTLNFFVAAASDEANDADLFIPYEIARELITSPESLIWRNIANVLNHNETPGFMLKGGLERLQRGLVFDCQTVCSFVSTIHSGKEISVDEIIETIEDILISDEYD